MSVNEDRLDRIEVKLDRLADAIVSLARMEERMVTLFKRMDAYDLAQHEVSDRVAALEKSVGTNGNALRFAERLFWIVVTAGLAATSQYLR